MKKWNIWWQVPRQQCDPVTRQVCEQVAKEVRFIIYQLRRFALSACRAFIPMMPNHTGCEACFWDFHSATLPSTCSKSLCLLSSRLTYGCTCMTSLHDQSCPNLRVNHPHPTSYLGVPFGSPNSPFYPIILRRKIKNSKMWLKTVFLYSISGRSVTRFPARSVARWSFYGTRNTFGDLLIRKKYLWWSKLMIKMMMIMSGAGWKGRVQTDPKGGVRAGDTLSS